MRKLRLVAVDEDGTHLVLAGGDGEDDLRLPIDERLHAALRGDRARLGQLEITLESQLRPRDIQARVRGGESVESVAQAAGVSLDRIMRFAGPVLDERQHVAARARRAALRRPGADGPAPLLEDSVLRRVADQGHDPDDVVWDAWRRGDGRWAVTAGWRAGSKSRSARFVFDAAGRSVHPDDDEARWVAGEKPPAPPRAVPSRPARLQVVPGADPDPVSTALAFGADLAADDHAADDDADDAIEQDGAGQDPAGDDLEAHSGPVEDDDPTGPVPLAPPARPVDEPRLRLSDIARNVEDDERADLDEPGHDLGDDSDPGDDPHRGQAAAAAGRGRRPSVPSWDEIMFGRRRKGD